MLQTSPTERFASAPTTSPAPAARAGRFAADPPPAKQPPAGLTLEVTRGRTRHPRRPVHTDRFTIGSSPDCDLCIGGEGVPALHSVIVNDGGRYHWEALASIPPLLIDGVPCRSAVLEDGDVVQVGQVSFTARQVSEPDCVPAGAAPVDNPAPFLDPWTLDPPAEDLSRLSAEDLVDRLDRDMTEVEEFESKRRLGAEGLLHAALQAAAAEESGQSHDAHVLLDHLERMAVQLNSCAGELERRAGEIARSHQSLAETLCHVLQAERHLSDRLSSLLDRISTEPADDRNASLSAA